jgi:hypothetical protein
LETVEAIATRMRRMDVLIAVFYAEINLESAENGVIISADGADND